MTKIAKDPETIKREIGEHVKIHFNFDKDSAKAVDDEGDGILEAIITTSSEDRHRENIVTTGIDTKRYMENPVVLYGHDYWGFPIGKTIKLTEQKNKIKARFELAINEYPFAADVYKMVKAGFLNAVSIGGIVREWSEDYRSILQMEMLEFSIVSIPANPDALITQRSFEEASGKSFAELTRDYEDFRRKTVLDKVGNMPDDDLNQSIKSLKALLGILEESANADSSAGNAETITVKRIKKYRLSTTAKELQREVERTVRVIKLKS